MHNDDGAPPPPGGPPVLEISTRRHFTVKHRYREGRRKGGGDGTGARRSGFKARNWWWWWWWHVRRAANYAFELKILRKGSLYLHSLSLLIYITLSSWRARVSAGSTLACKHQTCRDQRGMYYICVSSPRVKGMDGLLWFFEYASFA